MSREAGFALETLGNLTFAMGGEGDGTGEEVRLQTPTLPAWGGSGDTVP